MDELINNVVVVVLRSIPCIAFYVLSVGRLLIVLTFDPLCLQSLTKCLCAEFCFAAANPITINLVLLARTV